MRSFRIFNRRAGALLAAIGLTFATLLPSMVAAATVTDRSIALSSSTKAATGVTYRVVFTSPSNTKDFVVDFCDSAAINTTCNAPSGFSVSSATTATAGYTRVVEDANTVEVTLGTAGTAIDMELANVTNPSAAGVIYARITTYAGANDYTAANNLGTYVDDGGVAISITDGFAVSGRVLETLVFCASGVSLGSDCSTATAPSVTLGSGGILTDTLETGTVYTLVSTNAASGAIVNLKSNTTGCGGLSRVGAASFAAGCGIAPVAGTAAAISTGDAKFGVMLSSPTATTGQVNVESGYSTSQYFMDWQTGDTAGVTSPYGDPIYNTNDAPVNVGKTNLTFGANISNVTPAGNYSASMSLIATGKF